MSTPVPAISAAEQQLRVAMAAGRMATWNLDLANGQLTWSDETSEVFGGPDGSLPRDIEALLALIDPEDGGRQREAVRRAIEKVADPSIEFRLSRPDGADATVNMSGRVLADADGRPVRIVGVATDVTQQRRSEEHLRRVQRMEALGRLAGGMAHEANNQMAVVIGFTDFILRRSDVPEDVRGDLEQIRRAAKRTASVTQQLLTFSRRQLIQPLPYCPPMMKPPFLTEGKTATHCARSSSSCGIPWSGAPIISWKAAAAF